MESFKDLFFFNILEQFSLVLTVGITKNILVLNIQKQTSPGLYMQDTVEKIAQGFFLHVYFAALAILIVVVHLYS